MLHVHDLVDYVSEEAEIAGRAAAEYLNGKSVDNVNIALVTDGKIRYTVPQVITELSSEQSTELYFRVSNVYKNVNVVIRDKDGNVLLSRKKQALLPGGMEHISINGKMLTNTDEISIGLEDII